MSLILSHRFISPEKAWCRSRHRDRSRIESQIWVRASLSRGFFLQHCCYYFFSFCDWARFWDSFDDSIEDFFYIGSYFRWDRIISASSHPMSETISRVTRGYLHSGGRFFENGDDHEVVVYCHVQIGERLCFDTLGLHRRQGRLIPQKRDPGETSYWNPHDLDIDEVDFMPFQTIRTGVSLMVTTAFLLYFHRVEHLAVFISRFFLGSCEFEHPICKGRLAVIDMGDDSEIPDRHACILAKQKKKQFCMSFCLIFEGFVIAWTYEKTSPHFSHSLAWYLLLTDTSILTVFLMIKMYVREYMPVLKQDVPLSPSLHKRLPLWILVSSSSSKRKNNQYHDAYLWQKMCAHKFQKSPDFSRATLFSYYFDNKWNPLIRGSVFIDWLHSLICFVVYSFSSLFFSDLSSFCRWGCVRFGGCYWYEHAQSKHELSQRGHYQKLDARRIELTSTITLEQNRVLDEVKERDLIQNTLHDIDILLKEWSQINMQKIELSLFLQMLQCKN